MIKVLVNVPATADIAYGTIFLWLSEFGLWQTQAVAFVAGLDEANFLFLTRPVRDSWYDDWMDVQTWTLRGLVPWKLALTCHPLFPPTWPLPDFRWQ